MLLKHQSLQYIADAVFETQPLYIALTGLELAL